ncbi:unnamed protein product [Vicia faba]|uniref:EF-hand domain-containing protein n=1 Tax=Vicia faba TaxID=3906 RepID=A0AAV0ZQ40_VICFA|nr:unnamed protein product [Vicia faba]
MKSLFNRKPIVILNGITLNLTVRAYTRAPGRGIGRRQPASDEELNNMIREVDGDGDGCISLPEFIELNMKGVDSDEILENLKDAFAVFDMDGNGSITAEKLNTVMRDLGE